MPDFDYLDASHDLRNLLSGVLGNLSLVKARLAENHPAMPALLAAESAALKAREDLIRRFLGSGHQVSAGPEWLSVPSVLDEVLRLLGPGYYPDVEVLCGAEFHPELLMVKDDFMAVVTNLLVNAREASGINGRVTIAIQPDEAEGQNLRLDFKDNGPGIPDELKRRIFEPQFTTKTSGNGIGLPSVQQKLALIEAGIRVTDCEPMGACFSISFPSARVRMKYAPAGEQNGQFPSPDPKSFSRRILVLDDQAVVQQVLQDMLEHLGFTAECFSDASAAVAAYREAMASDPFGLVIVDKNLPNGLTGDAVFGQIRKLDPGSKGIIISGLTQSDLIRNPLDYGFVGSLQKPFNLSELESILSQFKI
jgi:two-component system cell cycle sensor histidine kinase/response regulator CckA